MNIKRVENQADCFTHERTNDTPFLTINGAVSALALGVLGAAITGIGVTLGKPDGKNNWAFDNKRLFIAGMFFLTTLLSVTAYAILWPCRRCIAKAESKSTYKTQVMKRVESL